MILRSYSYQALKLAVILLIVVGGLQYLFSSRPSDTVPDHNAVIATAEEASQDAPLAAVIREIPKMEPAAGPVILITDDENQAILEDIHEDTHESKPQIISLEPGTLDDWLDILVLNDELQIEETPIAEVIALAGEVDKSAEVTLQQEKTQAPTERTEAAKADTRPKVVIIIDDLGLNYHYAKEIASMRAPLTLAYLPYAEGLEAKTRFAKERGHELIIHVPMQPVNDSLDPGPVALKTDMTAEAFDNELEAMFNSFEGYVGINNHMGSKLTQHAPSLKRIMTALKERDLLFVDSKTIGSSIAAQMAQEHGVPHAERHVFLDHYPDYENVKESLALTEKIARNKGLAIAIGHPKRNTIRALKEWLPTLEDKGFNLVPVSAVVDKPPAALSAEKPQNKSQHSASIARVDAQDIVMPAPLPKKETIGSAAKKEQALLDTLVKETVAAIPPQETPKKPVAASSAPDQLFIVGQNQGPQTLLTMENKSTGPALIAPKKYEEKEKPAKAQEQRRALTENEKSELILERLLALPPE